MSRCIRRQLDLQSISGKDGELIDHVELVGPPSSPKVADARKICCSAQDLLTTARPAAQAQVPKLLAWPPMANWPGTIYRPESIVGTVFEASFRVLDTQHILPTIVGEAYVTSEATCY